MLSTILFVFFLLFLWKLCSWYYAGRRLPPGLPNVPLIGALPFMRGKKLHELASELDEQHGQPGIVSLRANNRILILVNKLSLIKELFVSRAEVTSGRPYQVVASVVNPNLFGIVNAPSPKWEQMRRFSLRVLRDFGVGKSKVIDGLIMTQLAHIEEAFDLSGGEAFDPSPVLHRAVAGIICSLLFGQPMDQQDTSFDGYLRDASNFLSANFRGLIFFPMLRFLYRIPACLPFLPEGDKFLGHRRVMGFLQQRIDEHRQHFTPDVEPADFVDAYLAAQRDDSKQSDPNLRLEDRGLRQLIFELFIAGSDTTYLSLRWALLCLARDTDMQDRVFHEINDSVGTERLVNFVDATALHYTRAVVYEVLRFGNVAGLSIPHTAAKDIEIGDYRIPKDCILIANIYQLLRDPEQWKNPNTFDPNNFLDDEGHFVANEAFVAFSIGRRTCPGESLARNEVFVFLASILQKYHLTLQLEPGVTFDEVVKGVDVVSLRAPLDYKICAVRRD